MYMTNILVKGSELNPSPLWIIKIGLFLPNQDRCTLTSVVGCDGGILLATSSSLSFSFFLSRLSFLPFLPLAGFSGGPSADPYIMILHHRHHSRLDSTHSNSEFLCGHVHENNYAHDPLNTITGYVPYKTLICPVTNTHQHNGKHQYNGQILSLNCSHNNNEKCRLQWRESERAKEREQKRGRERERGRKNRHRNTDKEAETEPDIPQVFIVFYELLHASNVTVLSLPGGLVIWQVSPLTQVPHGAISLFPVHTQKHSLVKTENSAVCTANTL